MLRADLASAVDAGLWGDDPDAAYPTPGVVRAIIEYALDHGWNPATVGGQHVVGTDAELEIPGFHITDLLQGFQHLKADYHSIGCRLQQTSRNLDPAPCASGVGSCRPTYRFRQREMELYTSSMADPITFRPTAEDTENLAILTADGTSPTHAIRHALEIAAHNKRQEDLRADAARLAANPEYQAEIRAIREELDELRAW
jgi:hypothetical protein